MIYFQLSGIKLGAWKWIYLSIYPYQRYRDLAMDNNLVSKKVSNKAQSDWLKYSSKLKFWISPRDLNKINL